MSLMAVFTVGDFPVHHISHKGRVHCDPSGGNSGHCGEGCRAAAAVQPLPVWLVAVGVAAVTEVGRVTTVAAATI